MRIHPAYIALCLLAVLAAPSCLTPTASKTVNQNVDYSAVEEQRSSLQQELRELTSQLEELQFQINALAHLRENRNKLREELFSGNGGMETIAALGAIDIQIRELRAGKDDDELHRQEEYLENRIRSVQESLSNLPPPAGMGNEKGGGGEGGEGGGGDSC